MEINKFLERFHFFYDSIIRDVRVSFRNSFSATKVDIIISTRDNNSLDDDGWVKIHLEVNKVTEFNFRENSKISYQVLSNALHIWELEGFYYFDFGFYVDPPENPEELKKSHCYVIGQSWSWKTEDYKEFA